MLCLQTADLQFFKQVPVFIGAIIQTGTNRIDTIHGITDDLLRLLGKGLGTGQLAIGTGKLTLVGFQCVELGNQNVDQGFQVLVGIACRPVRIPLLT